MARKIVCTKSGRIFPTLTKAAAYIRMEAWTLWKYINNKRFNRTTMKYHNGD